MAYRALGDLPAGTAYTPTTAESANAAQWVASLGMTMAPGAWSNAAGGVFYVPTTDGGYVTFGWGRGDFSAFAGPSGVASAATVAAPAVVSVATPTGVATTTAAVATPAAAVTAAGFPSWLAYALGAGAIFALFKFKRPKRAKRYSMNPRHRRRHRRGMSRRRARRR